MRLWDSFTAVVLLALSAMMRFWLGITGVKIGPVRIVVFLSIGLGVAAVVLLALASMVTCFKLDLRLAAVVLLALTAVMGLTCLDIAASQCRD
jgi:hypothetical protein